MVPVSAELQFFAESLLLTLRMKPMVLDGYFLQLADAKAIATPVDSFVEAALQLDILDEQAGSLGDAAEP